QQGVAPVGRPGPVQLPHALHQGEVGAEEAHLDVAEGQLTHLAALALVALLVAVVGLPPAELPVAPGGEAQLGGVPVAGHEPFEVPPVPGLLLVGQYLADGLLLTPGRRRGPAQRPRGPGAEKGEGGAKGQQADGGKESPEYRRLGHRWGSVARLWPARLSSP